MTAVPVRLDYEALPAVVPSYLRAATTLTGGLSADQTIPEIVAELPSIRVRQETLARYRRVCGFAHSTCLPLTYLHVLAFPIHMAVMTRREFPLKLLGLIHVRNEISQHRAIGNEESLHLEVRVGGHRDVSKGVEFDLVTRVRDADGALIWEELSVMLSRQKTSHADTDTRNTASAPPDTPPFKGEHESEWTVPADIGRRYAEVAGVYNPIHLSA
jgi:hypothetical protein